jgi:phosphohistidine phosphatase
LGRYTESHFNPLALRIILLRHAQTADKQPGQRDYDRALTSVGEAQARKSGQHFVLHSFKPDFVLCSASLRTRSTATLVGETAGVSADAYHWAEELYEGDGDTWMHFIRQLPDVATTALCVGHNPVLSWLASDLSEHPVDLAPSGFVVYETPAVSWITFDRGIRELFTLIKP